jgi:hypothetical protein
MYKLKPKVVFEAVSKYLGEYAPYGYEHTGTLEYEEVCKLLFDSANTALVGRADEAIIRRFAENNATITVFDRDLSIHHDSRPTAIDTLYQSEMKKIGVTAEFGTIHNIPFSEGAFDFTFSFSMPAEAYLKYAFKELIRVCKMNGVAIVKKENGNFDTYRKISVKEF